MKIKICGLYREEDIEYVNEARPDYAGFVLNFPKSHRNISLDRAEALRKLLCREIIPVGVFVNAGQEYIAEAAKRGIISVVQLHGGESEEYIAELKTRVKLPIIKAVKMTPGTVLDETAADYLLLDSGMGTGKQFDHSLIDREKIKKPFFLAGGLTPENLAAATEFSPFAVDLSSGVETDKIKDKQKIIAAVNAARNIRKESIK